MRIVRLLGLLVMLVWSVGGFVAAQDESGPQDNSWAVRATLDTSLPGGVRGTVSLLSPDGQHIAQMTPISLCVYNRNIVEETCFSLDSQDISPDAGSLRWSPDSRYLTFSENFFTMFVHSTIWLADTETGELRALIEPPADRRISFTADDWPAIDLLPQWSPDGSLYFLRFSRSDGVDEPTTLYRFDDISEPPVEVGALHDHATGSTYALAAHNEQIAFNVHIPAPPEQQGAWLWALNEDEPVNLHPTENAEPIVSIDFSPDGTQLLLTDYRLNFVAVEDPSSSAFSLLVAGDDEPQTIDTERYVLSAGWSPDGSALAYIVFGGVDADSNGLYITSEPGTPGQLVLAGDFYAPTAPGLQPLVWANDNTLLIGQRETFTALIVELGRK